MGYKTAWPGSCLYHLKPCTWDWGLGCTLFSLQHIFGRTCMEPEDLSSRGQGWEGGCGLLVFFLLWVVSCLQFKDYLNYLQFKIHKCHENRIVFCCYFSKIGVSPCLLENLTRGGTKLQVFINLFYWGVNSHSFCRNTWILGFDSWMLQASVLNSALCSSSLSKIWKLWIPVMFCPRL